MFPVTMQDVQILVATAVFLMGCVSILLGVFVLISRSYSNEVRAIAAHTARLSQKGMAQEVTGLVNSASELVGSINQLVRTAKGAGIFLISFGMVLLVAAYWVIQQIEWAVA